MPFVKYYLKMILLAYQEYLEKKNPKPNVV